MISLSRLLVGVSSCRFSSYPVSSCSRLACLRAPIVPASRLVLSCHPSYRLSPRSIRQAGRGVVCLLASASGLVVVLVSALCSCVASRVLRAPIVLPLVFSASPCLPRGSWLVSLFASCGRLVLACCFRSLVSPLPFSPFFDKAGGESGGSFVPRGSLMRVGSLFACRVLVLRLRAAGGRLVALALVAWRWFRRGGVGGCSCPCCVWFVVSLFVYINWVLARV